VTEIGANSSGHSVSLPDGGSVVLAWSARTDVGRRRKANEDSFIARSPIFAVADGMGGHLSGDLASAAVVQRLDAATEGHFIDPSAVASALELALNDITEIAGDSELGVGTTVTGATLTLVDDEPHFAVFNVGDSRVYAFDDKEFRQVTVDHSLVQELVDSGKISKEQSLKHPDGNIITRAIGFNEKPVPDVFFVPTHPGLRLVICSDGLTGELEDERIRLNLAAGLSTSETASALMDAALASGARDNVTVIVVDVLE
jgi:PPM family protein phosphatase